MQQAISATHASAILDFFAGLDGELHVRFEAGTHSAWLYDLLVRRVAKLVVCNPRKNALWKAGSKSDGRHYAYHGTADQAAEKTR